MNHSSKSTPLVSAIIPCYNYGKYLSECVDSVLKQTYKNIEIIIINDGSSDNSEKVAKRYAEQHEHVTYVSKENEGIVKTRNRGIKLAKGEYLIQLDADDWLDKSYVEETLRKTQSTNSEIVYTQVAVFGRVEFVTKAPEFNLEYLKHDNYIHASALVHKNVFKNRRYDEYLSDKGNEDWDIFLDACLDGATAALVDKPLLHYRKHTDASGRADKFEGTKKEVLVRHHILSKQNAKHPKDMWYFSPYITVLKEMIDLYQEAERLSSENAALKTQFATAEQKLEKVRKTRAYTVYRKLQKARGKLPF